MSAEPEVIIDRLSAGYGGEPVLLEMSLEIRGAGLVQVIGPNGAGKTTLLKAIAGLLKPMRGHVIVNGVRVDGNPRAVGSLVGYVPQLVAPKGGSFPLTPWELVLNYLLLHRRRWPRLAASEEGERASKALKAVGLPYEKWNRPLRELSGGELQRVLIARAIAYEPKVLLLDEPFSSVDPVGRVELARLIGGLGENVLVLVSSHDPTLLMPYTKAVILLNRGYYLYGRPEDVLKAEPLKEVYGDSALLFRGHVHICDEHFTG